VFTNAGTDDCITQNSISSCCKNLNTFWRKHIKNDDGSSIAFEDWHLYSLRKTARTNFSNWGDWVVCEKMVGHKMAGEADKYDYNLYAHKMVPVYEQWWKHLNAIKNNESNIIDIHKKLMA